MKNIVRRVSAAIIIFAFVLPWVDFGGMGLFVPKLNGIQFIKYSFGLNEFVDEPALIVLGIGALLLAAFAVWTVIQPKALPNTLMLVPTILLIILLFATASEASVSIGAGVFVLVIGAIGSLVSIFLNGNSVSRQTLVNNIVHGGVTASSNTSQQGVTAQSITAQTNTPSSGNERTFCSNCGQKVAGTKPFCGNCGIDIAN